MLQMVRDDVVSSCIPLLAHGATLGMLHLANDDLPLVGRNTDEEQIREIDERRQLALLCAEQFGLAVANMRLRGVFETQSTRDVLTGLHNRRWFQSSARTDLEDSLTTGGSFSLVSIDVDRFNQPNDNFGHSADDVVLREIANVLHETCSDGCTPCLLCGEEFVIIVPRTTLPLRGRLPSGWVRGRAMTTGTVTIPQVTISAGVAIAPSKGQTVDGLLEAADRALHTVKRAGRYRVVRADGIMGFPAARLTSYHSPSAARRRCTNASSRRRRSLRSLAMQQVSSGSQMRGRSGGVAKSGFPPVWVGISARRGSAAVVADDPSKEIWAAISGARDSA